MPGMQIKGTAFINRYEYLRQTFGEEALQRFLSGLPAADAKSLRLPNASDWYPLETLLGIDKAIVEGLFEGDESRMVELGEFSLHNNLTTIYRFLFRVLNTETMVKNGVAAFRKSVSEGAPVVEARGPRELAIRFEGFDPGKRTYCHFLRGTVLGMLKASGTRNPSVTEESCLLRGDPACGYRARWE